MRARLALPAPGHATLQRDSSPRLWLVHALSPTSLFWLQLRVASADRLCQNFPSHVLLSVDRMFFYNNNVTDD